MAAETTHIHLKYTPKEVTDIIKTEKARIFLEEKKDMKQEFVVHRIIEEWKQQKEKIKALEK